MSKRTRSNERIKSRTDERRQESPLGSGGSSAARCVAGITPELRDFKCFAHVRLAETGPIGHIFQRASKDLSRAPEDLDEGRSFIFKLGRPLKRVARRSDLEIPRDYRSRSSFDFRSSQVASVAETGVSLAAARLPPQRALPYDFPNAETQLRRKATPR